MSKVIEKQYRIVADEYLGYEVQVREVLKSILRQTVTNWHPPSCNTHSSLKDAQRYIDEVLITKVYEQGTYPPRTPKPQQENVKI